MRERSKNRNFLKLLPGCHSQNSIFSDRFQVQRYVALPPVMYEWEKSNFCNFIINNRKTRANTPKCVLRSPINVVDPIANNIYIKRYTNNIKI